MNVGLVEEHRKLAEETYKMATWFASHKK